jgi:hypothetical protein
MSEAEWIKKTAEEALERERESPGVRKAHDEGMKNLYKHIARKQEQQSDQLGAD